MASAQDAAGSDYATELERVARRLVEVSIAAIGELEETISPAHLRALQSLEGLGSCNVTELGDELDMLPSTASRLSDRLTAAGLITRKTSPTNRRATLLELTAAGRRVLDESVSVRISALRHVTNEMTGEERGALLAGARAFTAAHDRLQRSAGGDRHDQPDPARVNCE